MRLSTTLTRLVEADPILAVYAFYHLGQGVPYNPSNSFYCQNIQQLRAQMLHSMWSPSRRTKLLLSQLPLLQAQLRRIGIQLDRLEQEWATQLLQEETLRRLLVALGKESPDQLRARLRADEPALRLLSVHVVASQRLHLENDLIDRLGDPSDDVSQAARHALARLARGTDLGPPPRATPSARGRAVLRWKSWLALQEASRAGPPADRDAGSPPALDFMTATNNVLGKGVRALVAVDPEILRLRNELVLAKGAAQDETLQRLKDAKGVKHTEAISQAIPFLPRAPRTKARDALAERLTRMKAKTLRDKFGEDDAEVRQAAALACARKGATEHVPDLLALLDDPEPAVIQAAHAALTQLTRQDFGPAADAGPAARAKARAAWRDWWQNQRAITAADKEAP
jgi:hypothetical protein